MKLRRDYHNHLLRGTVDDIDSRGAENRVGADLFWLRKSAFFQTERIELALGRTGFVTKSVPNSKLTRRIIP
jgi:hypothetical protein